MSYDVTVSIEQGRLRGEKVVTKTETTYYSFQGIPYAKPPIGSLRFKAPQPPDSWEGIRDALHVGSVSPQIDTLVFIDEYVGEEDCLYLNVYTPAQPTRFKGKLKPVMVWIHGGDFKMGSGNKDLYEPDHLITSDVILVTMNYRLGALGFLYTEDSETSGNNGLKDQVMALRWVQQNIAQFGGDPDNVTIFGQGAGGASVYFLLLSLMTEGLFHKAIAQSGSVLNPWAFVENPRERAFRFGEILGYKTEDSNDLVEFLRSVSVQRLVETTEHVQTLQEKANLQPFFVPHVEIQINPEDEVFLLGKPIDLLSEGKFHKVPFMAGVTSHEGMLMMKHIKENPVLLDLINNTPELLIPQTFKLQTNTPKSEEVANKIKTLYFGDNSPSKNTLPQLVDLYTDTLFIHGIKEGVMKQLNHTNLPIYFYQFSFDQYLGFIEKQLGEFRLPGVCHNAEMTYLFKGYFINDERMKPDTEYMKMVKIMVKLWTNFAKTGNPTPKFDSEIAVKWIPVTKSKFSYLNIDMPLSMQTDILEDRMIFWDELQSSL